MAQLKKSTASNMVLGGKVDVETHINNIETNLSEINTILDPQYIVLGSSTTVSSSSGIVPFTKLGEKGDGFTVSGGKVTIASDDIHWIRVNLSVGMSSNDNRAWAKIFHNNVEYDTSLCYGSYCVNKVYTLLEVKKGDIIHAEYVEAGRLNADGLYSRMIIEKVC